MVGTNHTRIMEFMRYSPVKSKNLENFILGYMIWYYNHCDYVTAPSKLFLDEMKDSGFNGSSKAISNPIDNSIFNYDIKPGEKDIKKKFYTKYYRPESDEEKKQIDEAIKQYDDKEKEEVSKNFKETFQE